MSDKESKALRPDLLNRVRRESVRKDELDNGGEGGTTSSGLGGTMSKLSFLSMSGEMVSPWWSEGRDAQLRKFWKAGDHLSGAIYAMDSKMVTIPFHIEPRDMSVKNHIKEADQYTRYLLEGAEYGRGWSSFYSTWIKDYLTQDNGRFAEIVGAGSKLGPIVGKPITLTHLDAGRCQRTGDFEFPVIYTDTEGKRHKMHRTRIMFDSSMPSPNAQMKAVGFCAVSRALHNARHLMDIGTYKEEKLGSRPPRALILAGGGLNPNAVGASLEEAASSNTSRGFQKYAPITIIGSSDIETPTIEIIDLASLPEGYDEQTATSFGMAAISLAFGVDARELWPASQQGATRADAMLSHIKSRGKGPGQILQTTERLMNQMFLPRHLRMVFDYQDDTQDAQVAEIRQVRSRSRERNLLSETTTVRVERQLMLKDGDISNAQFTEMELADGRLVDGKPSIVLFMSEDEMVQEYIDIGIANPLDVSANDLETVRTAIDKKKIEIFELIGNTELGIVESTGREILSAFDALLVIYEEKDMREKEQEMLEAEQEARKLQEDKFGDNMGTKPPKTAPGTAEVKPDTKLSPDDKKGDK